MTDTNRHPIRRADRLGVDSASGAGSVMRYELETPAGVVTVGAAGDVVIDTSTVITGAPIGTNTTGQEAEGPHCITGGGGHG